jgi:glucose/arabinose dehydrogenase
MPAQQPFDEALVRQLQVPDGFTISVFATGLNDPRMLEVGPNGTVYVTRWHSDDVLALRDVDGDGRADTMRTVAADLDGVHGIDFHDGKLYLASPTMIWTVRIRSDRSSEENNAKEKRLGGRPRVIVDSLPDGGQHENQIVQFGPDGLLYVSVGSSCNDCAEANLLERATLMRFTADGERREVIVNGLRNTIGFDWHPVTNELWGMDNGSDAHGDDVPPEELNQIKVGANYGWPICYAERIVDPMTRDPPRLLALRPGESEPLLQPITREEYCAQTEPSVLGYQAHAAPIWMQFYDAAQFPAQ